MDGADLARAAFEDFLEHWRIAARAIDAVAGDDLVLGLYLSGSFARGDADGWSDIDFHIVTPDGKALETIRAHDEKIRQVADVLTIFPATHLGDPQQIIVFYRAGKPIHVDYLYRELSTLEPERKDEDALILLDRFGHLGRWLTACRTVPRRDALPRNVLQGLEDRFWGWCWYAHAKIERGELWEARDAIEYVRTQVLLRLAHHEARMFEGNRRIESKLPYETQARLRSTIPGGHTAGDYANALSETIAVYTRFFDELPAAVRTGLRLVDRDYFESARRRH